MGEMTDPLAGFASAAIAIHELFVSYTSAGFTEQQALYLVGELIRGMIDAAKP